MKHLLILITALAVSFTVFADGKCVQVLEDGACKTEITFYSNREACFKSMQETAKNESWDIERIDRETKLTPLGGIIGFIIKGPTINWVNLENWSCVIQDMSGNEIMQINGEWDPGVIRGTDWHNFWYLQIKGSVPTPFKIFITSKFDNDRDGYIIDPTYNYKKSYK